MNQYMYMYVTAITNDVYCAVVNVGVWKGVVANEEEKEDCSTTRRCQNQFPCPNTGFVVSGYHLLC